MSWTTYVVTEDGIAWYPKLFGVYFSVWMVGAIVLFVAKLVIEELVGFAEFPRSGPTELGNLAFLSTFLVPLIPVAILEARRRRRGGYLPLDRALALGYAHLIPWADVVSVELKPRSPGKARAGRIRWRLVITTKTKKNMKAFTDAETAGRMKSLLEAKIGERLYSE